MNTSRLVAALLLSAALAAPTIAEARGHHHHYRHHHRHHYTVWRLPYAISYVHNYGPGPLPGTFSYYDGPSSNRCFQSAAAYIGQDRRRHPCQ